MNGERSLELGPLAGRVYRLRRLVVAGATTITAVASSTTGVPRLWVLTGVLALALILPACGRSDESRLDLALIADIGAALALWWMFDPVAGVSFILFYAVAVGNLLLSHRRANRTSILAVAVSGSFAPLHFIAKSIDLPLFHTSARSVPEAELLVGIATTVLVLAAASFLFRSIAVRLADAIVRRQASDARFVAAFAGAPIGMMILRPDGTIVEANPALNRMTGKPDLVGRNVSTFIDGDSSEIIQAARSEHMASCQLNTDAGTRHATISMTSLDENSDLLIAQVIDVTERTLAEETVRHRLQFERVIRNVSSHLIEVPLEDADAAIENVLGRVGQFAGVDRAYVFQFDVGGESASNTHEWCRAGIASVKDELVEVPNEVFPWFTAQIMAGRNIEVHTLGDLPEDAAGEREMLAAQGIRSMMAVPMINAQGVVGFVGFDWVSHVSTWSDDDLALARIVGEMVSNMILRRRAHDRLAELLRSKDEFVARVSHELRTPLTVVLGLAEELRGDSTPDPDLMDMIAEQSRELSHIVEDLLVAARAEIGGLTIRPEVLAVADEIARSAAGAGVTGDLTGRVDPELRVWGDPIRLRQILRNILTNAVRYGGDHIEVSAELSAAGVRIQIADDGSGVPEADRERIFEPYVQANNIAGVPASMGLGLSVARSLARLMGGDLAYEYIRGWSRFTLTLPAAANAIIDRSVAVG